MKKFLFITMLLSSIQLFGMEESKPLSEAEKALLLEQSAKSCLLSTESTENLGNFQPFLAGEMMRIMVCKWGWVRRKMLVPVYDCLGNY